MILVSACLLGINCRYDGENNRNQKLLEMIESGDECIIPVCPEQLGGLPTPRNPSIVPEGGEKVLDGDGKVIMRGWGDVTMKFVKGAEETLKIAEAYGAEKAIFKSESPSCGSSRCPKNFQEKEKGVGVTTALLRRNGIEVISEEDI